VRERERGRMGEIHLRDREGKTDEETGIIRFTL
jgi:hypothetical protein